MPTVKIQPYGKWDAKNHYQADKKGYARTAHFELDLAVWRDPFTLPHTGPVECTKVCDGPFGTKYCCEYGVKCQFLYVRGVLVVDIAKYGDYMSIIKECHDTAVAAGLVSAIVAAFLTGGAGAAEAAVKTYVAAVTACLTAKITESIVSVRVEFRSYWGDWENCT